MNVLLAIFLIPTMCIIYIAIFDITGPAILGAFVLANLGRIVGSYEGRD